MCYVINTGQHLQKALIFAPYLGRFPIVRVILKNRQIIQGKFVNKKELKNTFVTYLIYIYIGKRSKKHVRCFPACFPTLHTLKIHMKQSI